MESNAYLLSLKPVELIVYPYFFIWNDFAVEQLSPAHCGIKWHRHADEPVYRYDDPRCRSALDEIRRRGLPVVLEEEFDQTVRFIRELADGITVVIPHLGMLNGGFDPSPRPACGRRKTYGRTPHWPMGVRFANTFALTVTGG